MEGNGLGVLLDVEVDDNGTIEGELLEVRLEGDVVVSGDDVGGEELAALDVDPTRHIGLRLCPAHLVVAIRTVTDWCLVATRTGRSGC